MKKIPVNARLERGHYANGIWCPWPTEAPICDFFNHQSWKEMEKTIAKRNTMRRVNKTTIEYQDKNPSRDLKDVWMRVYAIFA